MNELFYLLKGKEVVACGVEEWAKMFSTGTRVLRQDYHYGILVSTVFLGIDHSFHPEGPPIVFETMIFGGRYSDYQKRYATWDEAMEGHWEALTLVINSAHLWDVLLSPLIKKFNYLQYRRLMKRFTRRKQ